MKTQITVQQNLMKNIAFLLIISLVLSCSLAFGYDRDSHIQIAVKAVENSSLNDALYQIGFTSYNDPIKRGLETKPIYEWIGYGSRWEDGIALYDYGTFDKRGILYCHFYNPITDKGYTNFEGYEIGQSLIDRANDLEVDINGILMNEWSYSMAKDLYYAALTGDSTKYPQWIMRDNLFTTSFIGKGNMNAKEREQFFSWTFQALGHTLHLIGDASVPAHTRNDLHGKVLGIGDPEPYENWTESKADFAKYNPEDSYFPGILNGYGSESWVNWKNFEVQIPDVFIDTGQLTNATTPPITGFNQGLAEYSHANFLSSDTVFNDGTPNTISTIHGLADIGLADLGNVAFREDREIGDETYSFFYVTNNTAQIDHFALCGIAWQIKQMEFMNGQTPETGILYTVDDPLVDEDYAKKLLPRAVGYSAGLLDYFFRGRLEVSVLPVFVENAIYGIQLKIKNVTPTEEAMTMSDEDRLVLVFRYTPEGANADGSEDKFVTANAYGCIDGDCDADGNLDGIQYGDEATINFFLPEEEEDRIGMQIVKSAEKSVKCMLVFKGKLGEEETAVIGKYFTLGKDQVRFNEEWDNGPTGNYPWEHISCCSDNGSASNIVENSILIKDNTRYKYSTEWHFNQSYIELVNTENPEGIHITPDTYVEMKIDDMSIDASNPDIHWQALNLIFNDEILIQFTQEGQNNYNNYAYRFNLGENTVVNIYSLFDFFGIEMPSQLYLTRIDIVQQFYEPENPPGNDENQHMEVDSIRIVEGKHEE